MPRRLPALVVIVLVLTLVGGPRPSPAHAASGTWDSWSRDQLSGVDRELADPSALQDGAQVHVYGTTARHCRVGCEELWVPRFAGSTLRSPGTLQGDAMPTRPDWVADGDRDIWAPTVVPLGSGYTMYFAATAAHDPYRGLKCLGVARATSPEGPFVPEPAPLRCSYGFWNIDPDVVEDGGRRFLVWREDDAAHVTGKVVAAPLRDDGTGLAGEPVALVLGTQLWEDGYRSTPRGDDGTGDGDDGDDGVHEPGERRQPPSARGRRDGSAGIGPIENPSMARHPDTGQWLLTWSANRWESQDYATGLATCAGPTGPCTRLSADQPWLRRSSDGRITTSARFGGSGGLDLMRGRGGRLYALFHAYRDDGHHPGARRVAWAYRVDPDPTGGYRLSEF
jgi:glycosyl hydrolase family 43